MNLRSIIFDLIQHLIDWLFKSVKWRITLLVIEVVLQPVCTLVLIKAVLGHSYHFTDRSEWKNYSLIFPQSCDPSGSCQMFVTMNVLF